MADALQSCAVFQIKAQQDPGSRSGESVMEDPCNSHPARGSAHGIQPHLCDPPRKMLAPGWTSSRSDRPAVSKVERHYYGLP